MKNKLLCACVVYPGVEKYLRKCFESIANQSYRNFDLLIIEDNFCSSRYHYFFNKIKVTIMKSTSSNAIENRETIIKTAIKENYDYLMFFDCDDEYHKDRIKVCLPYLKTYSIVVHDMKIINENSEILRKGFINDAIECGNIHFKDLLYHNFSGLGNSAYKVASLSDFESIDRNIIAFDWWLALSILINHNGIFIPDYLSFYRRYENNISNLNVNNSKQIEKEFMVKTLLYKNLFKKFNLKKTQGEELKKAAYNLRVKFENSKLSDVEKNNNSAYLWWDYLN